MILFGRFARHCRRLTRCGCLHKIVLVAVTHDAPKLVAETLVDDFFPGVHIHGCCHSRRLVLRNDTCGRHAGVDLGTISIPAEAGG